MPRKSQLDASSKPEGTGEARNTAVYATGLPEDTTVSELHTHFSRCGIVLDEVLTGRPRIKLYTEPTGPDGSEHRLKGDALIVYLRPESVVLAVNLLDDSELRPGTRIRVQAAEAKRHMAEDETTNSAIENNNNNNSIQAPITASPSKRPRVEKEAWKKHMQRMNKRLEWFDEDAEAARKAAQARARNACILVLHGIYTQDEIIGAGKDLGGWDVFVADLTEDIKEECVEKLGCDPEDISLQLLCTPPAFVGDDTLGWCSVKFKEAQSASAAAALMNGRWFDGRRITASVYDGSFPLLKRKRPDAFESEDAARLEEFSKWIERGNESDDDSQPEDSSESTDER